MASYPTQKLLLVVLFVNLFISLGQMGHFLSEEYSQVDLTLRNLDNYGESYRNEENIVYPENLEEEGSFGRGVSMGKMFFTALVKGFSPFGVNPADESSSIGVMIAYIIMAVRSLMYALLGLELYNVLKNRKGT